MSHLELLKGQHTSKQVVQFFGYWFS